MHIYIYIYLLCILYGKRRFKPILLKNTAVKILIKVKYKATNNIYRAEYIKKEIILITTLNKICYVFLRFGVQHH